MIEGKRVLVTGSAGVIGLDLLKRLISAGAKILSVDRYPLPIEFTKCVTHLQRDITSSPLYELHDFQPEVIFHLAAAFERSKKSPEFWRINWHDNMLLSHYLIDLAKDVASLETILFASSYLIYSPILYTNRTIPGKISLLKETDIINPRNITGSAKYYTERELEFVKEFFKPSLRIVNARIFRVYGCGSMDVISRWVQDALTGKVINLYNKQNRFDYIFAGDVSEGLVHLAECIKASGIVNLGTGVSQTVQDVINILTNYFPDLKIRDVGIQEPFETSCADISILKQLTGWSPTIDLEHGIRSIIEYEKHQKQKDNANGI